MDTLLQMTLRCRVAATVVFLPFCFLFQRAAVREPAEQASGQRHREGRPGDQPEGYQQGLLLVRFILVSLISAFCAEIPFFFKKKKTLQ